VAIRQCSANIAVYRLVRVFWHQLSPSNCSLGLHLYSRYDPLSKLSFVPMANPSTAYCVGAAVAFADKTMEARNAIPVLITTAPTLPRLLRPWLAKTTTSETRSRELRKIRSVPIPNRQTLNCLESQLANPGVKGSRANSGGIVTIALPETKDFRNGPHRSPGVLY